MTDATDPGQAGSRDAAFYLAELDLANQHEAIWRRNAAALEDRYRAERGASGATTEGGGYGWQNYLSNFNIFYANTNLLKSTMFTKAPPPDVRRRYKAEDDIAKATAEVLEGALTFVWDEGNVDAQLTMVTSDALIAGRGVPWVRYELETEDRQLDVEVVTNPETGEAEEVFVDPETGEPFESEVQFSRDGEPMASVVLSERIEVDHVSWRDYRESANARTWPEVWWVARRHMWTRREAREELGNRRAERLQYTQDDTSEVGMSDHGGDVDDGNRPAGVAGRQRSQLMKAEVWELWDRDARDRVWISRGVDDILRNDGDPFQLTGFYPLPKPVQTVETTNTRIPVPEFDLYRDQADELNEVASRRRSLIRSIRAVALIDGAQQGLPDLSAAKDGDLVPILRPQASDKSLREAIEWWPIEQAAQVVSILGQRMQELRDEIFEIIRLSDLTRGVSKASETATAQRIKGSFGQFALAERAGLMSGTVRELMRIMAELMSELVAPETLQLWSGQEVDPKVMEVLRSDGLRKVRIDVETAETAAADVDQRKRDGVEWLTAVAGAMQQLLPLIQIVPAAGPFVAEAIKATARPFKFGRTFEEQLDAMTEAMSQPPPPPEEPEPTPDAQLQAEVDVTTAKMQDETKRLEIGVDADTATEQAAFKLLEGGREDGA